MPETFASTILTWIGITLCLTQSAMFSGLNLTVFSISRLRLEVEFESGNHEASRVMKLREDANYTLTTILWGNVGTNVLLTLLSNSVLVGIAAFAFSTFFITVFGEILPQAYFSRHTLRMAAVFSPAIQVYRILLFRSQNHRDFCLISWSAKKGPNSFAKGKYDN